MPNDSSTGGYLTPSSRNFSVNGFSVTEVQDKEFAVFLQGAVVGITGLAGNLVRPRWQLQPPVIPNFGTDWAAIGKGNLHHDIDSFIQHTGAVDETPGFDTQWRTAILDIIVSFYGQSREFNADLLVMGLNIPQNREALFLNGYNLVLCTDVELGADLIQEQWLPTSVVNFQLRRLQGWTWPILDLASAELTVDTDGVLPPLAVNVTAE
jgi:hypothetical protein